MRNPRRNGIRLTLAPLIATLLWVLPAAAATYWVAPTGSSSNTGADSTHAKSIGWIATATLQPGDVIRFAHGRYVSGTSYLNLKIRATGSSANPIYVTGDTLYPSSISIGGIDFGQYTGARYVWVQGLRGTRMFATTRTTLSALDGYQGLCSSPDTYIRKCVFDSLGGYEPAGSNPSPWVVFGNGADNCAIFACQFGGGVTAFNQLRFKSKQTIRNDGIPGGCCCDPEDITSTIDGNVFSDNTVTLNKYGDDQSPAMEWVYTNGLLFQRNKISITIQSTGNNGTTKFYGPNGSYFSDNKWTIRSLRDPSITGCIECNTHYERELYRKNTFERDTFYFAGGNYPLQYLLSSSGTCGGKARDNTYNACVFVDSIGFTGTGSGYLLWAQNYYRHNTFTNNVVVSKNEVGLFNLANGCDSCTINNNTFVALGNKQARVVNLTTSTTSNEFRNNIIYAPNDTISLIGYQTGPQISNNLYYSIDSTDVVNGVGVAASGERYSMFGDPLLQGGSTWSWTYDAHIGSQSPARKNGQFGVDIGAFQFGDPPPQVYRYYVAPYARGGRATNTGADSSHAITLYKANQIAEPGALFILLGGDYTADDSQTTDITGSSGYTMETGTAVAPMTGGFSYDSTLVVRYVSKWYYDNAIAKTVTSAPDTNSYRVSAITITQPFVKVQGLTADGAITVYSGTSNGSVCTQTVQPGGTYCWRATDDSVTWCKARSMSVGGATRFYFNNCWIWTPLTAGASGATTGLNGIWGAYGALAYLPGTSNVALTDCFIKTHVNWGQAGLQIGAHSDGVTFTRCALHCELEPASNTDTLAFVQIRDASNVRFVDCRWRVNADSLVETAPYAATDSVNAIGLSLSDGAQFVTFLRDTLDLGCRTYSSRAGGVIQVRAQGGLRTSVNNVVWQDCIVRGDWAFIPTVKLARWSFLRSALGSSRLSPLSFGRMNAGDLSSDSLIVDRCTIYSDGAYPALACLLPSSVQSVRLTRNIYYRRATAVGQADTGAVVRLGGLVSAQPGQVTMDENVYYSATDSITNSVYVTGWQRTGVGPDSAFTYPGLPRLQGSRAEWEANSLWGSPGLTATSIDSTFDGSLACQRNARRAYAINYFYAHGDSAVGATQTEANVIPAAATALDTTLATPTAITVSFAAPANNGRTGSGTCAGYYVAYSTRQGDLTEANWNALSKVTATAAAPGATVTKQITGLSNVTTYWFAVRALSRCGTLGPLSTPQCAITRKADGTSSLQDCRSDF